LTAETGRIIHDTVTVGLSLIDLGRLRAGAKHLSLAEQQSPGALLLDTHQSRAARSPGEELEVETISTISIT